MNVMIIGNGGREHALAWRLRQSPQAGRIFVAPGNAGTHLEAGVENVAIDTLDFPALVQFARQNDVGLTIVGPEAPLVAGVVDYFPVGGDARGNLVGRLQSWIGSSYGLRLGARVHCRRG